MGRAMAAVRDSGAVSDGDDGGDDGGDRGDRDDRDDGDDGDSFDPLELRRLAVTFDYLMYKVGDRVADLAEATRHAVAARAQYASLVVDSVGIAAALARLDELLARGRAVETEMLKLAQWERFIAEFEARLDRMESVFGR